MTTPVQPPEGSDDDARNAGSDADSSDATDERQPRRRGTGVEIGMGGEPSSFEPEEDGRPDSE